MIDTLFKPNRAKCGLGRHFRLMRNNDWTSNGYWAMLTKLEPSMISELASTNEIETDLGKLAREFDISKCKKLKTTDELCIAGRDLALRLEADGFDVWVKPHYLTLMWKATGWVEMYSKGSIDSIYFYDKDRVVGIVMPMRINKEVHHG